MTADKARIYHNPRCSKSREALALLREHGIEPEVVLYLEHPPSARELEVMLGQLGVEPRALLRTKEDAYAESGLTEESSMREIADAIVAQPILLERPLVVIGDRAVIGRPPERVLELLEG
ncbi:MAG: arsenate reductase (glutaredoxin) [Myxococcales bacterium]